MSLRANAKSPSKNCASLYCSCSIGSGYRVVASIQKARQKSSKLSCEPMHSDTASRGDDGLAAAPKRVSQSLPVHTEKYRDGQSAVDK